MGAIRYRLAAWLRTSWRTAGALTLLVAIVGTASLTLLAGARRTLTAPERYSSWRGAVYDVQIQQERGRPRTGELRGLPAVSRVDSATFVFGGLTRHGSQDSLDALVFAGSAAAVDATLQRGREPSPGRADEFVASSRWVKATGSHLGDRFDLSTLTQTEADAGGMDSGTASGPKLTGTLVGVIGGPAELQDGSSIAVFPTALLDRGDVGLATTLSNVALARHATTAELRHELDGLSDGATLSVEPATWVPKEVRTAVSAVGQGWLVLAIIAIIGAIVVLGQVLTRQFRDDDDERATLRTLGFARLQLAVDSIARAAIAVAAGTALSVVAAYALSSRFPTGFVASVEPHPGRQLDPLVHGAGSLVFAAAVLVWVAASLGASDVSHTPRARASLVDRLAPAAPGATLATGMGFAFGTRSAKSRAARVPLLGLGAVFCVLVGAVTFGTSARRFVSTPSLYGVAYDAAIGSGGTSLPAGVPERLAGSPDVQKVTLFGTTSATARGHSLSVVGMDPIRGLLAPPTLTGRLPQSADEIALGRRSAGQLHVSPGDRLTISTDSGRHTLLVTGLIPVPDVEGVDRVGYGGLTTAAGLRSIDPSSAMTFAAMDVAPGDRAGALKRLSALTGMNTSAAEEPPPVLNIRRVRAVPFSVAGAVAALGLLSLGHLLLTSMRRRRRDIAILRAIGADRSWVRAVLHWQATVTAVALLALAVPLGVAAGGLLYRRYIDGVGGVTDVSVPLAQMGAGVVALLVVVNLITAATARSTRRLSPARLLTEG